MKKSIILMLLLAIVVSFVTPEVMASSELSQPPKSELKTNNVENVIIQDVARYLTFGTDYNLNSRFLETEVFLKQEASFVKNKIQTCELEYKQVPISFNKLKYNKRSKENFTTTASITGITKDDDVGWLFLRQISKL